MSKKLDYSLIILAHLAYADDGSLTSARDIAATYGLPLPVTAGILKTLSKHEITRSIRGVRGGYILSIPPKKLTLRAIAEAIEGPFQLADCISVHNSRRQKECGYLDCCPVRGPIRRVHETLTRVLSDLTLSDLASPSESEPNRATSHSAVSV